MANGDDWRGFVNIRLDAAHKKAIKALRKSMSDESFFAEMVELVDDGYQVSLSPDKENDAIIATLTGKECENGNRGFSMSQRHDDPYVAMAAVLFAHKELAQRGTWEEVAYDWRKTDW